MPHRRVGFKVLLVIIPSTHKKGCSNGTAVLAALQARQLKRLPENKTAAYQNLSEPKLFQIRSHTLQSPPCTQSPPCKNAYRREIGPIIKNSLCFYQKRTICHTEVQLRQSVSLQQLKRPKEVTAESIVDQTRKVESRPGERSEHYPWG